MCIPATSFTQWKSITIKHNTVWQISVSVQPDPVTLKSKTNANSTYERKILNKIMVNVKGYNRQRMYKLHDINWSVACQRISTMPFGINNKLPGAQWTNRLTNRRLIWMTPCRTWMRLAALPRLFRKRSTYNCHTISCTAILMKVSRIAQRSACIKKNVRQAYSQLLTKFVTK